MTLQVCLAANVGFASSKVQRLQLSVDWYRVAGRAGSGDFASTPSFVHRCKAARRDKPSMRLHWRDWR